MSGKEYSSKGIYKQQMMRKEKSPSIDAKKRAQDWLWDDNVIRVFVDASELQRQGIFGLGVIYVGQGLTSVISKKHYNQSMRKMNVYGEILAVEYALVQMESTLREKFSSPSCILVYSDWSNVDLMIDTPNISDDCPAINQVAERIINRRNAFLIKFPELELEIMHMSADEKKYNPFYRGAHNASRKAIGI